MRVVLILCLLAAPAFAEEQAPPDEHPSAFILKEKPKEKDTLYFMRANERESNPVRILECQKDQCMESVFSP